ncbi:hypothetical protein DL546_006566 [Coniochaeta pulveracea]|uniref:Uncharacterized protein n=1 Tax=Coniochaeta pulveracea TaxID=177199 RepID=A0A420YEQ7_9PEZI|nr:hypothetical protein DL546_006566 [Coniochaeta pulveracea]
MSDNNQLEDGLFSVDINLDEDNDSGSSTRFRNDPRAPHQRKTITERKGAIDIRCLGKDVVHGFLKDGEGPATLVVYEFELLARKKDRRIVQVDISFVFHGKDEAPDPEVVEIAPKNRMITVETKQTENTTTSREGKVGATQFGAELGGSVRWEKSVSRETSDATSIFGTRDTMGRRWGEPNGVSWTLLENKSTKTGVPAFFRTAVLLKRQDDAEFESEFIIKASVDLVSALSRLFGRTEVDDPILYDPTRPPTDKLRKYDTDNLEDVTLHDLSIVSFTSPIDG